MNRRAEVQNLPKSDVEVTAPDAEFPTPWFKRNIIRQVMPVTVLVVLILVVGAFQPSFLSAYSLRVLAEESGIILLMAIGQTMVILLGGIDLSIAALASFTSVLLALWIPDLGWVGLVLVILLTTGIGALQGFIQTKAQVPSFVVTLAGLGLWSGIALAIAHATVPLMEGYELVGWMQGQTLGIPHSFGFALLILCLVVIMMRWLPLGRYIYAIGISEPAAILSGIRVARIKVFVFAFSGFFAGLTGMAMVARTHSGSPTIADSLLLPTIAAVIVGGTAITGGFGGFGRTLIGALSITVMRVGMAIAGVDPGYEPVAYGIVIIIAVALTIDRTKTPIVK